MAEVAKVGTCHHTCKGRMPIVVRTWTRRTALPGTTCAVKRKTRARAAAADVLIDGLGTVKATRQFPVVTAEPSGRDVCVRLKVATLEAFMGRMLGPLLRTHSLIAQSDDPPNQVRDLYTCFPAAQSGNPGPCPFMLRFNDSFMTITLQKNICHCDSVKLGAHLVRTGCNKID